MKRKVIGLFLTIAMLLTQLPILTVGAAETDASTEPAAQKRVLLYTENFEGNVTMYKFHDSNGTKEVATASEFRILEEKDESDNVINKAGSFYLTSESDQYKRVGYQFSEDGISTGKMYVKVNLKSVNTTGLDEGKSRNYGIFLLGNNKPNYNWLSLIGYDKGNAKPAKIADQAAQTLGTEAFREGVWYTYEGTLDLDAHSMDATLYDDNGAVVGTRQYTPTAERVQKASTSLRDWPNGDKVPAFKSFSGYYGIELDNIEIYCDPIEVQDSLNFVNTAGISGGTAYTNTEKVQLTFNHNASAVEEGAVKLGNTVCAGTLSADGKTYTIDLPAELEGGQTYNLTVDQTKISLKGAVVDGEGNEKGVGVKTLTFTAKDLPNLNVSKNFEDGEDALYKIVRKVTSADPGDLLTDAQKPEVTIKADGENHYVSFNTASTSFDRKGFPLFYKDDGTTVDTDAAVTTGTLKVHLRFKANDTTINGTEGKNKCGTVMLGSCSGSDWRNYFSILDISQATKYISAATFSSNSNTADKYILKDADNQYATFDENTWYTYDAEIDLDNRSLDIKVVDETTNAIYTLKNSYTQRTTNNVYDWAQLNNVNSLMVLAGIDLDDIAITYAPTRVTGLSFPSNGVAKTNADLYTKQAAVSFNQPVREVSSGAVKFGGTVCDNGTLSADRKTYTFDLPESLVGGREYTVTVDISKIPAANKLAPAGENTVLKFTPTGLFEWSEDFTNDVTIYSMGNSGLGTVIADETFLQPTENGNRFGRFGGSWGRMGVRFDENGISEGKLNLHFRFRPYEKTLADGSFGTVLIGNCDAKWCMLVALGVSGDGSVTAGCANENVYPLKDAAGNDAKAKQDVWYTYDAVLDLDNRSMDVTVIEDGTNAVYTLQLNNMIPRPESGNEWRNWPHATNFKDIACLFPMDLDDIFVTTSCAPSLSIEGDSIKASAVATSMENSLLVAQYAEDGTMLAVEEKKLALSEGEATVFDTKVDWMPEAVRAKAFLWDGLSKLNPLEKAAEQIKTQAEYKVLAIGNSFCDDSIAYLHDVAAADGVSIMPTNCYYGGRMLATHASRFSDDQADYTIKQPGLVNTASQTIKTAVGMDDWDVVVLQATTHEKVRDAALWDDNAAAWTTVLNNVSDMKPNAKRIVHMSWAPYEARATEFNNANNEFTVGAGENARTAYLNALIPHYEFGANIYSSDKGEMIPTAIAVEYVLTRFGDTFTETAGTPKPAADGSDYVDYDNSYGTHGIYRDSTCHMTWTGRILASLVWYETITGNSALDNKYIGPGLSEADMQKLREAAHYACETYRNSAAE